MEAQEDTLDEKAFNSLRPKKWCRRRRQESDLIQVDSYVLNDK